MLSRAAKFMASRHRGLCQEHSASYARMTTCNSLCSTVYVYDLVSADKPIVRISTLWSSSPWISVSTSGHARVATPHRQHFSPCTFLCGKDRSGWMCDMPCTTRHHGTAQHTYEQWTPGHKCWTSVLDGPWVNHLRTQQTLHITAMLITRSADIFK